MRSLCVTLALLTILIFAVGINSFYVRRVCGGITEAAELILHGGYSEDNIERLCSLWGKNRRMLGFSIESDEIEQMDELIESLSSLDAQSSTDELGKHCRLIIKLSNELAGYERISFESLF